MLTYGLLFMWGITFAKKWGFSFAKIWENKVTTYISLLLLTKIVTRNLNNMLFY